ncbi:hypothetical protein NL108_005244, partial [Boleophthalmus pectinirostris]
ERAVANTGNQGIEQAMDWLMEHENDPDIDEPFVPPAENVLGGTAEVPPSSEMTDLDPDEGSLNYIKGHEQTSHFGLTMDLLDLSTMLFRLEELMRVKQAERREREKAEEIEREKTRRKQGQELQQIRQKLQEDDMKKLADQRRKEKMEDKLARQRVKEKIARDREERAQKFGGGASSSQPSPTSPPGQGPPPTKREYDESRIQ